MHGCNTDGYGMEQGLKEKLNVDIEGAEICFEQVVLLVYRLLSKKMFEIMVGQSF